jgi:hypothetical protein
MGFWPFSKKPTMNDVDLKSNAFREPSPLLQEALADAAKNPLNDLTFRLVIAWPEDRFTCDIPLHAMDSAFTAFEGQGIARIRGGFSPVLFEAANGKSVDRGKLGTACLAFFDREFTVGANKGKTIKTAWNALTLEFRLEGKRLVVERGAQRLEYPLGKIDLRLPGLSDFGL